jgi:hypothetical protein
MSLKQVILVGLLVIPGVVMVWIMAGRSRDSREDNWNANAIRATFEVLVPAHNDASLRYLLENRTDSDYRIASESEVQIVERTKSTADLRPKAAAHLSGEFSAVGPGQAEVHFALVWTSDHDIDPLRLYDFVPDLNVRSFVLFDKTHRYQIEFPVSR